MAKQRSKRASKMGSDEFEVAPFSFDSGQSETSGRSKPGTGTLPDMPLGQFSDAEMEFEPFMFDPGDKGQAPSQGMNVDAAPSGFSFEPFSTGGLGRVPDSTTAAQGSPIVGGELPLPAYFSPSQFEAEAPAPTGQEAWAAEHPTTPVGREHTTSGLVLPTGPMTAVPGMDTSGLGMSRGDQMTGRTPTGPMPTGPMASSPTPSTPLAPLTPLNQPASTPVTGLGRTTRGNTGPLGPLPPDRVATPNASWSDSSLASIEDFSSILIAMQAGKKLRQSGPLSESMIPQAAAPAMEAPAVQQTTDQLRAQQVVEQRVETPTAQFMPVTPTIRETPAAPSRVEAFEHPTDNNDMPEWARQATQEYTDRESQAAVRVEENAPSMGMGAEQAMASKTPSGELSSEYSWVTGHMAEPQANAESAAVMEVETQVAEEAPVMVAQPEPAPMSATAVAAQAELEKRKKADKTPSNLDPEVVEALRKVEPVLASGTLTGDEIEFEGFMFNKGASAPLSTLPAPSAEDMEELHDDMGPVFDPTLYAVSPVEESDDTDDYGDMDFLQEELDHPIGAPSAKAPEASSATGGLPFWLQGDANEAPTGMLLQDIARRGWGTKEFLIEQPQPSIPSEWVGSVSEPAQKVETASEASPSDLFGAKSEDTDYGQLPDFEPFDFSMLPTNDTVESLGFNTEELTGLSKIENDPMTATVNLAAVADLLGAEEETWTEEAASEPMSAMPWEEEASVEVEAQPQQEWTQGAEEEVEMPTVTSLEMYDEEPVAEPAMEMEPAVAVEMHSEMPSMEVMDAQDMVGDEYSDESEAEMPTLALDADAAMEYVDEAVAVQESPVESYVEEVEATPAEEPVYEAPVEVAEYAEPVYEMPAEPVYEAPVEPVRAAPAKPSMPSMPTAPIGEHSTRSWMSNATTDLSEGALADMVGEHGRLINPVTEMDLAMDGEEVSPFNYDQLELESDEQHTGHLDADQIQRTYGTGKLAMPDEEDMLLRSRPLNDVWSEADGDASLFVTGAGAADEEASADSMEAEPAVEMAAQPEYESEPAAYMAEESEPTGYMVEESEPYGDAAEAYEEPVAVVIIEPVVEYIAVVEVEAEQPVQEQPVEEFKVRVAQRPWMAYSEAQNRAESTPPAAEMPSYPTPQYAEGNVELARGEMTGPLHDEQVEEYTPAPMAAAPNLPVRRTPNFDREVKLPSHIDILVTGPLPALEGFEDMNDWASGSSQDVGTQLAMAAGYAQAEDFDAALRMYRKIIRKPGTSDTMLMMIGDDLTDIEDVAGHLPRYYQVMGDLLLRLGRHREAIEAYNKLK